MLLVQLLFTFAVQEMRLVFPNSYRINRGNYVVKDLAEACRANDVTDLIVLHEHRGTPGAPSTVVALFRLEHVSARCHDCFSLSTRAYAVLHTPQRYSPP